MAKGITMKVNWQLRKNNPFNATKRVAQGVCLELEMYLKAKDNYGSCATLSPNLCDF